MMTTKPLPSATEMLARVTVAVLISLAPIEVHAASPESTELAQEAARLCARAVAEEDPEAAAITAFEAHNLWNRAFEADGDEAHLCKARALLAKISARPKLDDEFRASLESKRDVLPRCPKSGPSQKRLKRIGSSEKLPDFLEVPEPAAEVAQVDPPVETGDDEQAAPPPLPPVQAEPLDDQPERPQHPGRALQVGGGVTLALGLLALGVMTPFAVRDAANAKAIDSLAAKNEAAGRLSLEEAQQVAELTEDSRMSFRSSLALGLAGGVATVLGTSLLIAGQRRSLSFAPRADRNSASISLQGRF